jgi:UDP-3-O-[3-hydroxymyristoyl] glucosamine N-acyltransferase
MVDSRFFVNHGPFSAADLAAATGATLHGDASRALSDVSPLDRATAKDVSFFDNAKYVEQFSSSSAGACFLRQKYIDLAPKTMLLLVTEDPYRCYAIAAQKFYPHVQASSTIAPSAVIAPSANLGANVGIGAGAVIGANVKIGARSSVGANTVISDGVEIGEDTHIGAVTTISHCLIGNRVIIHRGVHIGQDGFGFALGREGHVKVPQLGRVVIEDDVEIGSGTTIDRGTGPDKSFCFTHCFPIN